MNEDHLEKSLCLWAKYFNSLLSAAVVRVRLNYRLRLLQLLIKMGFPEGTAGAVSGEVCVKYQKKVFEVFGH